jgi:hypothetical protein
MHKMLKSHIFNISNSHFVVIAYQRFPTFLSLIPIVVIPFINYFDDMFILVASVRNSIVSELLSIGEI